jgi:hypothetical protein
MYVAGQESFWQNRVVLPVPAQPPGSSTSSVRRWQVSGGTFAVGSSVVIGDVLGAAHPEKKREIIANEERINT